jgi:hypothetical protein
MPVRRRRQPAVTATGANATKRRETRQSWRNSESAASGREARAPRRNSEIRGAFDGRGASQLRVRHLAYVADWLENVSFTKRLPKGCSTLRTLEFWPLQQQLGECHWFWLIPA